MSSSGQMHTGHPGPGTSSMFDGIALRRPAVVIDRSCPPQTFMTLIEGGSGSARIRSSHSVAVLIGSTPCDGRGRATRRDLGPEPVEPGGETVAAAACQ